MYNPDLISNSIFVFYALQCADFMEFDGDPGQDDEMWLNSFAPNDGYCPSNRKEGVATDRRSSSRMSRRNSSRISLDMFNNYAYGMLRHMRNPKPSAIDGAMYRIWKKVGVYFPLTGFVSIN